MSDHAIVLTTIDSEAGAERLIAAVLDARLAACVQSRPVTSHYVWEGERRRETEIALQMKIKRADWDDVAAAIRAAHSYETPEIVLVELGDVDARYAAWITGVTR
jgi:periplasmic divalent cation tolerance protein